MPNHWESSARPLFVRTVFVNGNRHAILFEEDPLVRYGNSPYKKISRSSSSLSFASELSLTSSESQDSNSDERVPGLRDGGPRQRKDLSSELQSCLIKLQLASGNLGSKSDDEKCCCHAKETETSQEDVSKQRNRKGKRDRSCRRKRCEHLQEESKENKSIGQRNGSCYFYNFERTERKKNYCVVKISSQPPQFTVSCRCDLEDAHHCRGYPSARNNMVISATIHNLFMTSRKEKLSRQRVDNTFLREHPDVIDLCWNSYLTKSYYNSLSERVFQWLDLSSKRKSQKQKADPTEEDDSSNSIERIFSGKTFTGESKKTECSDACDNKPRHRAKRKEIMKREASNEEVEAEVKGEPNVATALSAEKTQDDFRNYFQDRAVATTFSKFPTERHGSANYSTPTENCSNPASEVNLNSSTIQKVNALTPMKPPLKVQDLLLDYNLRKNFGMSLGRRSKRKIKETRDSSNFIHNKRREATEVDSTEEEGEENVITRFRHWEERVFKSQKYNATGEETPYHCNRSAGGYADKIRNQLLTEGFSERNQKSINNLNFTRSRPVLIRNLLPSQHGDETTNNFQGEKIVWGSEKDTGRLQLHIFMPSLLLKDASDDSLSECENVLNLS